MGLDYEPSSEAITPRAPRLSEAMHRCLFEEATDGIIIVEAATSRLLDANPRVEELTGYQRHELLSMSTADLIAPQSAVDPCSRWGLCCEDSMTFAERLIRRKDGSVFVAELSGRALSEGSVVNWLRDVSGRKQLEADLCVSQARYWSALSAAPDAIAEVDPYGRLQMVSPATLRLFGCANEQDLLGRRVFDLVHPSEHSRALALLAAYRGGDLGPGTRQLWLRRRSGESVLCEVSAAPVHDEAGALVSHALYARDVTERSKAQEKIQHLSRLYSLLSHVNQAVIRSRTPQDLFQTVCDVAVRHGGFRMAWIGALDAVTQRLCPVAHAGHDAGYLAQLSVTLNDPQTGVGPAANALRHGRLVVSDDVSADPAMKPWRNAALARDYRTVASVALCVKGRNVAALTVYGDRVGFFSDDERRLMQELGEDISAALAFMEAQSDQRRAEVALRASEERFRSLVQNSMDAIAMYSADGGVRYQSPAVLRILGYGPSELLGTNVYELVHADDRPQMRADYATLLGTQGCSIKRDRRYRHCDGSYRWIESVATNLLHEPAVSAIVDNFRDITERMLAEEERQQLLAELNHAQKLDSIGRLAGGVAHDFNNMLAVILGSVELALADRRTPSLIQSWLREIRDAAVRSAELTRQLLTFARKLPAEPKLIDVNQVVDGALKLLRRLIGENVRLSWQPGTGIWPIEMDPTQLGQVLTNLAVNARDAICDVGTVSIETANVTLDAAYCAQRVNIVPGEYVRLTVSDTGVGMSPELQAHIFEPFFTTKDPGHGTGLGLATVYGIVKQYRGSIQVHSAPGSGARFDLYFPRQTDATACDLDSCGVLDATAKRAAVILVVEDEPQLLMLVTTLLRNLGYGVISASSPQAALNMARAGQLAPDLLLSDVVMPTMNGVELSRVLRVQRPELKTILMSGYVADAGEALPDEHAAILYKPFTLKALAESVQAVLNGADDVPSPLPSR